jgi:hypothetical protein
MLVLAVIKETPKVKAKYIINNKGKYKNVVKRFGLTAMKNGSKIPNPVKKIMKFENTTARGNISR